MTQLERTETTQKPGELSCQKAAKILFLSFKYSQGSPSIQHKFFCYFAKQNCDWRINDSDKTLIAELTMKRIGSFLKPKKLDMGDGRVRRFHKSLDRSDIDSGLSEEITNFVEFFNKRPVTEPPSIESISYDIAYRDYSLTVQSSRPRSTHSTDNANTDPYLSHICFYGLEGSPSGCEEFDLLFSDVKNHVQDQFKDGNPDPVYRKVIEAYIRTHPHKANIIGGLLPQLVNPTQSHILVSQIASDPKELVLEK